MTTSTRFIGLCAACGRNIKVQKGLLVHHGYTRPGTGEIEGDCYGVGLQPHELSVEPAKSYMRDVLEPERVRLERNIAYLSGEPRQLPFQLKRDGRLVYVDGRPDMTQVKYEDYPAYRDTAPRDWESDYEGWEKRRKICVWQQEGFLRELMQHYKRVQGLIDTWKPLPLTTIEEEAAAKASERRERAEAKDRARDQKLADAVLRMRERVDSAVRNRSAGSIDDIFGSETLRKLSGWRLSRTECLRLLERDDVWRAFGLIGETGDYIFDDKAPAHRALIDMKYGWSNTSGKVPEWPEALGGPKKKRTR